MNCTIDSEMNAAPNDPELKLTDLHHQAGVRDELSASESGRIVNRSQLVENPAADQDKEYKTFIGHLMMAPSFLLDNEYILRGYRINFNTKMKIFKSLFMLHNETVNVWTHLLGVFAMFAYFIYSVSSVKDSVTYKDILNGDQHYMTASIYNRDEVSLLAHSPAGDLTDFAAFCSSYLNQTISGSSIVSNTTALNSLSQYWSNEINM